MGEMLVPAVRVHDTHKSLEEEAEEWEWLGLDPYRGVKCHPSRGVARGGWQGGGRSESPRGRARAPPMSW